MESIRLRSSLAARPLRLLGADGVRIAIDAFGSPSASPVIFLHGGGQSRSAWHGAARAVATAGFQGVSLDLRGHGDSDWAPDGNYAFDRHVADVEAVIDALGRPAVLVGASLGGHVSLIAAARMPDRILALALADVTPWLDEDDADGWRETMRRSAAGFETLEEAAMLVAALRSGQVSSTPERLRAHMRVGEDGRFYWRWDPRFIRDDFVRHCGEGGLIARAAAALSVPTLLMHAELSTLVTDAQVARFREVLPALRYARIAGVGHMVTGDTNDAYVAPLLRFLGELRLASARTGDLSDTR